MTTSTLPLGVSTDKAEFTPFAPADVDQSRPPEIECLCPFCGSFNNCVGRPCVHCALEDTNATRAATSQRVGPWFVLQSRNPTAPGMNFDTLTSLIHRHVVTPRSVVRGPTTGQLWRLASKVRGLSREFGQCYDCGEDIERDDTVCPHCDRLQTLPDTPEARGEMVIEETRPAISETPSPVEHEHEPIVVHHLDVDAPPRPDAARAIEPIETSRKLPDPEPITVMSSDSDDRTPEELLADEFAADRHIPKDDLLTARDVAKAFLLEFGPTAVTSPAHPASRPIARDDRKLKTAASLVGVLLLAAAVWPVGHVVAGWFQPPTPATAAVSSMKPIMVTENTGADSPVNRAVIAPAASQFNTVVLPVAQAPAPAVPVAPSSLECTGGQLDLGIAGAGYFRVKIAPGIGDGTAYTRNGALARNEKGDLIVNVGSGYELIPPISIPIDATKVTIAADGTVSYMGPDTGDQQATVGQIQLCGFQNPSALQHLFGSVYAETASSGPCWVEAPGKHGIGQLMVGYVDIIAMNADTQPAVAAAPAIKPAAIVQPAIYVTNPPVAIPAPRIEPETATATSSDDPQTLLQAGMDAEARRDFPEAVADYERIESLPSDQWPASLSLRLKLTRKELKGDLR